MPSVVRCACGKTSTNNRVDAAVIHSLSRVTTRECCLQQPVELPRPRSRVRTQTDVGADHAPVPLGRERAAGSFGSGRRVVLGC